MSTRLADAEVGLELPMTIAPNSAFAPPADPDVPMIMIGPGTGLAPFLGFLAEREAREHRGRNWLFFGEQHEHCDYYYQDELAAWQFSGFLTRLDVAFSRDQRDKVYVQDRMRERGSVLWRWLNDGASLFVCGDALRMAKDDEQALIDIAVQHGGMSTGQAATYLKQLRTEGRYVRDVY